MLVTFDLAVVGAGIVGLANAWHAARAGRRVVLFERSTRAVGASVRNFGMVWPIGMPEGDTRDLSLRARAHWLSIAEETGLWVNRCGSLHLAYRDDEVAVMQEFAARTDAAEFIGSDSACARSPGVEPSGLKGALWSSTELAVDPRAAIAGIAGYLRDRLDVQVCFATPVCRVVDGTILTADGREVRADRVVVASGDDFRTLFPERFERYPLTRCKLQMMRTGPQPEGWTLGPHIAGGLTLRHYQAFEACPTLGALRDRVARETPELNSHGVHVMAAQNDRGELVLGDSHEYGAEFTPDRRARIDELILRELAPMLRVPDMRVRDRWFGTYAKLTDGSFYFVDEPDGRTRVVSGFGGAGMTLALGVAERVCADLGLCEVSPLPGEKPWSAAPA